MYGNDFHAWKYQRYRLTMMGNDSFLFALWCNVVYSYRTEFDPKSPHFHWADTQPVIMGWYGGFDGLCLVTLLCSMALRAARW